MNLGGFLAMLPPLPGVAHPMTDVVPQSLASFRRAYTLAAEFKCLVDDLQFTSI